MAEDDRSSVAVERQMEIYLSGMSDRRPDVSTRLDALEPAARDALSEEAFAYIAGGAGSESTMTANRRALERWRIVPRMLRDVAGRDTSVELFGTRIPSPLLLAPIGVLDLAHEDGDRAAARAAAAEGLPFVVSNQASLDLETVAQAMGDAPRWFQLYWSRSRELVASFVERAEKAGYGAIVVTLDTTLLGWRPRDLDLGYLPFLRNKGLAQYTSDPVFRDMLGKPPAEAPEEAVRLFVQTYSNPGLTWEVLSFLRERTDLPILLKGILDPDDARRALDAGMDGIVVSNHGGRQVDGAVGAADALAAVTEALGGRLPVLFDSGVRGGADVFRALALGASAVLVGRPYAYGLALSGEDGARAVLRNLKADFELTMALAGCATPQEIGRAQIVLEP